MLISPSKVWIEGFSCLRLLCVIVTCCESEDISRGAMAYYLVKARLKARLLHNDKVILHGSLVLVESSALIISIFPIGFQGH